MNKAIDTLIGNPFIVSIDEKLATILSTQISTMDNTVVELQIAEPILALNTLKINYTTSNCSSGTQTLNTFQNFTVKNLTLSHQVIPGKIEAEDFTYNNEFSFETCTDAGGGINTSYAATDKYLDYYVWVENGGIYKMDFRISVNEASAQIAVLKDQNGSLTPLKSVAFTKTGGWQNWQTQSTTLTLPSGKNIIRLLSRSNGYNLNWINFDLLTADEESVDLQTNLFPNPTSGSFYLQFNDEKMRRVSLLDLHGKVLSYLMTKNRIERYNLQNIRTGVYFVQINDSERIITKKLLVN
jgi:hypothetical protein